MSADEEETRSKEPAKPASAEEQLAGFIDKFGPENQALIRAVRKALRKRLPTANELVYDNYNFFVIGYCATERPSDCIVSIAAAASGLCFPFITEPPCQIRISCCLAPEARIGSSGWSQPGLSRIHMSRRLSRRQ